MIPMNMNHFYYFYEIARRGSFTEAARSLMVSQSSLSIQMKSFESSLGTKLFNRRRGGVELTESGQAALQAATKIFGEAERLLDTLREAEHAVKGAVSIATVNSIGIYILPEILKRFKESYPEVRMAIEFKHAKEVIATAQRGGVDVAIITWLRKYPSLTSIPLQKNKMFLVASPDHPLALKDSVRPHDLEKHSFLAYEAGTPTRMMIDALFKRMSLEIEYAMETSNVATMKHMAMAGLGLAFLPEGAVGLEIRQGLLKRLSVPALAMAQEITAYVKANRSLSTTARAFVDFMRASTARKRVVRDRG
jgi:DNA-binding transcriptional LysR family regulator